MSQNHFILSKKYVYSSRFIEFLFERILDLSDDSHRLNGIARCLSELLNGIAVDAHERIDLLLFGDGRWNRRFVCLSLRLRPLNLLRNGSVFRLDVVAVLQILQGIFVTAEDLSLVWKFRQLVDQGRVHLVSSSFEEAAAAAQKQSITSEHSLVVASRRLNVVTNVTLKMKLIRNDYAI